jgi:hypothetical protein
MSSYNFFSVTEDRIHGSVGRTGLFPAMGAGIGIQWQQGRDDGGSREWLMEAKERGGGRPTGGSSEEASKVSVFNAIT